MSGNRQTTDGRTRGKYTARTESSIDRRGFLAMSGVTATALAGWVTGTAAAQTDSPATGYGAATFGEMGYGGVDTGS